MTAQMTDELREAIGATVAAGWDLATAAWELNNGDDPEALAERARAAYTRAQEVMNALVDMAPAGDRHPHAQLAIDYVGTQLNYADNVHWDLFGRHVTG